ncbi:MAG: DUF4373 domain-containing protein [Mangrovibacterium sp.]
MARPTKKGMDYFPLDVDFFEDEKIEAIGVYFGMQGEYAAIRLLCMIYRNGYYVHWNELSRVKLKKCMPELTGAQLDEIVEKLVEWNFFSPELYKEHGVLTSRGIQRRFAEVLKKRRLSNEKLVFWILDDQSADDQSADEEKGNRVKLKKEELLHAETSENLQKLELLHVETTQSKVKEIKVNENTHQKEVVCVNRKIENERVGDSRVDNRKNENHSLDENADDVRKNENVKVRSLRRNVAKASNPNAADEPSSMMQVEELKPDELAEFQEIQQKMMRFFGFNEQQNFNVMREFSSFIFAMKSQNQLAYFRQQFENYMTHKTRSGERLHGWRAFIGTSKENYADGGWNSANWEKCLNAWLGAKGNAQNSVPAHMKHDNEFKNSYSF